MRCIASLVPAFLGVTLWLASAAADEAPYERLDPTNYQSFVANWAPDTAVLCAVMRSQADWDRVLHPAPTIGRSQAFAPPAAFWQTKAVVLVARVVNMGDVSGVLQVERLRRDGDALQLDYHFRPTPPAAAQEKWYLALAVAKPLPPLVRFTKNGNLVCTLRSDDLTPVKP